MQRLGSSRNSRGVLIGVAVLIGIALTAPTGAMADEGGVSFWLPGLFGSFMSRVVGVGPQIGYIFPLGTYQGYVNLKGYGEFDTHDRPHGYNAWLTLSISPPTPTPTSASPRMMMK